MQRKKFLPQRDNIYVGTDVDQNQMHLSRHLLFIFHVDDYKVGVVLMVFSRCYYWIWRIEKIVNIETKKCWFLFTSYIMHLYVEILMF